MPDELQGGVSLKRLMPSELHSNDEEESVRKQPKQAAWAVYVTNDKFYLLTYQPTPISAWVLHPQDNDASRNTLSNIIQRASNKRESKVMSSQGNKVAR
jgi:hypothetical protein